MICPQCGQSFIPGKRDKGRPPQRFCRVRCSRKWHGKHLLNVVQAQRKASATRRVAAADAIRAKLRTDFGVLTEREIALYRWVWKVAFNRGYGTGQRNPKRTQAYQALERRTVARDGAAA
jgi:hypothetical protein